jgi:hypothetical protein
MTSRAIFVMSLLGWEIMKMKMKKVHLGQVANDPPTSVQTMSAERQAP